MRAGCVALAIAVIGGLGCSLTRFDHQPCQTHADCRQVFGFGALCDGDGLCAPASAATIPSRCAGPPFPADLFTRREQYRDAIVLGTLMDHSSAAHLVREKAVRLAVREMADAGGLDGRIAAVVFCDIAENTQYDSLSRSNAAVASASFLSDALGVAAIIGPSASSDVEQVWDARGNPGTVIVTPAATSPALEALEPTSSDDAPGLLWRVAPPDSLQGTVIADDMVARQISQVVVIRETGAYGEGLAQVFQDRFTANGGTTTIVSIGADTDIGGAAAMAATAAGPEVLFISSQQDWIVKFLNAASGQAGYGSKEIYLTDAAANAAVLSGAATASALFPRVRGTRPAPRSASDYVYASFVANYKAEYGGEDPTTATYSAHSYDAGWLALYGSAWALLQAGHLDALDVGRGLRRLSSGAPIQVIPASWSGVVTAFRAATPVNLSGASGEIDFDPATRNVTAPIEIWNIVTVNGAPAIGHVDTKNPGG